MAVVGCCLCSCRQTEIRLGTGRRAAVVELWWIWPCPVHLCPVLSCPAPTQAHRSSLIISQLFTFRLSSPTVSTHHHETMAKSQQKPTNYGSTTPLEDNALPPSPKPTHMTTYTAGEDAGRLASLAKEFGLAKRREPREGVRVRVAEDLGELNLHRLKVWVLTLTANCLLYSFLASYGLFSSQTSVMVRSNDLSR